MSKITIPTVGTLLTLKKPWTFALYPERRNEKLWQVLFGTPPDWHESWARCEIGDYVPATFPKGTVLAVDRIYIRQKMDDYDSVSFRIRECEANPKLAKKRFWAKLRDVNEMDAVWDETTVPRRGEPVKVPEKLEVPLWRAGYFRGRMPEDVWEEIYSQSKLRENERTREFKVMMCSGKLYVIEVIDGEDDIVWVEG